MGMRRARIATAALTLSALVATGGAAWACAFDGVFPDPWAFAHPAALPVAVAINRAITAGQVEPVAATTNPTRALMRANRQVDQLAERLNGADAGAPARLSVLFVEADLWSRLDRNPDTGYRVAHHTAGAEPGEIVLVTGEPALTAILAGRLDIDRALADGVIMIAGDPAAVAATQNWLRHGLSPAT